MTCPKCKAKSEPWKKGAEVPPCDLCEGLGIIDEREQKMLGDVEYRFDEGFCSAGSDPIDDLLWMILDKPYMAHQWYDHMIEICEIARKVRHARLAAAEDLPL